MSHSLFPNLSLLHTDFFFLIYIVYFRNKDLEAELKCKCKSLSYIISHRTDPAVTSFQADLIHPVYQNPPPSSTLFLYLELYLHEDDALSLLLHFPAMGFPFNP